MTTDVNCNPHYWKCGTRRNDGDNRTITPERCLKCGADRDLIEIWAQKGQIPARSYTEIHYPNGKPEIKEDTMVNEVKGQEFKDQGGEEQLQQEQPSEDKPKSQGKGGNTTSKREYYDANKEAILADYAYLGFSGTARKWKIPTGSMPGLLRRWNVGTTKSHKRIKKVPVSKDRQAEDHPAIIAEHNAAKNREIESHADEIIADIDSGMMIKDICKKWNFSRKAFENFRRRHGLVVGPQKTQIDLVSIVNQIFAEETDIKAAKHRWLGAKSVIEMMRLR